MSGEPGRRFSTNASTGPPLWPATGSGGGRLNADDVSHVRAGWSVSGCSNQAACLLPWLPESPMVQRSENKDETAAAPGSWSESF